MDTELVPSDVSDRKVGSTLLNQEKETKKYLPWLHPGITLRDVPGKGKGLIATKFIAEGTVVWRDAELRQTWRFTDEEARRWPKEEYEDWINYCYQVEDTVYTGTRIRKGEKRLLDRSEYTNHSCDPNIWQEIDDDSSMTARRDIHIDDEVTYDYCTSETENSKQVAQGWKCGFGSLECRGRLTGIEYKDPTMQKKYERRWSPYIQIKIDGMHKKINNLLSTPEKSSTTTSSNSEIIRSSSPLSTSSENSSTLLNTPPTSSNLSNSSSTPTTPTTPGTPTSTNSKDSVEFRTSATEEVLVN